MDLPIDPSLKRNFKRENLRYVSDSKPGYMREKYGRKFQYYDTDGKRIRDKKILSRIESLAIPPAWSNIWIAPPPNGHLQATGIDDRRRKQYIYHPDWIKISKQNKFSKMIDFALALPKIRQKIDYELRQKDLDRERIIATVIWLLEHTFIRIGNEEYSKENNSFGLTTLRSRHTKIRGGEVTFRFRGKSGVENTIEVDNPMVVKTIKKCIELPGYELFKFIDDENNMHVVDSQDVNEFLQEITKDDFSAKDFRTWGASNLSALNFYKTGNGRSDFDVKKNITETVKQVAKHLNNTVAVCKSYYIHPTVIRTYEAKTLVPHFNYYSKSKRTRSGLSWDEHALVRLLQKYPYRAA